MAHALIPDRASCQQERSFLSLECGIAMWQSGRDCAPDEPSLLHRALRLTADITVAFEIIGIITAIETIAIHGRIRALRRLRKTHGPGTWRRLKGLALIRLEDDTVVQAELHWYEAQGIGRKEIKIKHLLV